MTGPEISGMPDYNDVRNFVVGSVVVAIAFAAYYGDFANLWSYSFYIPASALVLFSREVGIRAAVNVLDGYVDLELASDGATTTLFGSMLAVVSGLPIILLFPIYSSPSRVKYENWGKSVDVVWEHYKFWIAMLGIITLFTGFFTVYSMGYMILAQMYALFTLFQLMPFDYSGIPTGSLDGAEIMRWSGFYWLFFTGLFLVGLALAL
ncbi:MAG: hypothetical protein ABEJ36_03430 [Candidatus Nanosalina sp.]